MSPTRARLAVAADEAALRALSGAPMPGWVRLAYTREPDFFQAEREMGTRVQTVVVTAADGRIAGYGTRAVKSVYCGGERCEVGYLGGLRSLESERKRFGLARGFRLAEELDRQDPLPFYFTTILADNRAAREILTGRRAGMPLYQPEGRVASLAVSAAELRYRRRRRPVGAGLTLHIGDGVTRAELREFYRTYAPRYPLFPVFPDAVELADVVAVRRAGRLVAAAVVRDQRSRRQLRVDSYAWGGRWGRVGGNWLLRWLRYPALVAPGCDLPHRYLAYHLTAEDAEDLWMALLAGAAERIEADEMLLFALHERDARLAALRGWRLWRYWSMLYLVSWRADRIGFSGVPYLELAEI